MRRAVGSIGLTLALGVGCADTLPAEDLRITTATPVAKVSTTLLWQDFQADPAAARETYWGKAVLVTGTVTGVKTEGAGSPSVFFAAKDANGVQAMLIRDQAAGLLGAAKVGERLTLKCFCDDVAGGDVQLRSCIR